MSLWPQEYNFTGTLFKYNRYISVYQHTGVYTDVHISIPPRTEVHLCYLQIQSICCDVYTSTHPKMNGNTLNKSTVVAQTHNYTSLIVGAHSKIKKTQAYLYPSYETVDTHLSCFVLGVRQLHTHTPSLSVLTDSPEYPYKPSDI